MWYIGIFGDKSIRIRKKDGYFNATDMCKVNKKEWSNYIRGKRIQEVICALKDEVKEAVYESITAGANEDRGTWVHPRLVTHLAAWIDTGFEAKITSWVEEWRSYSEKNSNVYITALSELQPSISDQREREIQLRLKDELNGFIEVETPYGYIDLIYSNGEHNYIVEIKSASCWKHALGQILCYGVEYPNHKKVIVLFGEVVNPAIQHIYNMYDIELRLD
jgi:KilA-N domain